MAEHLRIPLIIIVAIGTVLGLVNWAGWYTDQGVKEAARQCLAEGGTPYRHHGYLLCLSYGSRVRWVE